MGEYGYMDWLVGRSFLVSGLASLTQLDGDIDGFDDKTCV